MVPTKQRTAVCEMCGNTFFLPHRLGRPRKRCLECQHQRSRTIPPDGLGDSSCGALVRKTATDLLQTVSDFVEYLESAPAEDPNGALVRIAALRTAVEDLTSAAVLHAREPGAGSPSSWAEIGKVFQVTHKTAKAHWDPNRTRSRLSSKLAAQDAAPCETPPEPRLRSSKGHPPLGVRDTKVGTHQAAPTTLITSESATTALSRIVRSPTLPAASSAPTPWSIAMVEHLASDPDSGLGHLQTWSPGPTSNPWPSGLHPPTHLRIPGPRWPSTN